MAGTKKNQSNAMFAGVAQKPKAATPGILSGFGAVRWMTMIASPEDPRTLMQIKRSRVDLARRYVFLCPTALNKHFDDLPELAKESAICVFKCSRDWAFQDAASRKRGPTLSKVDCGGRTADRPNENRSSIKVVRPDFSPKFLEWLETREAEDCVFWYKPERSLEKLSKFFQALQDPISDMPYESLLLDPQWWRVRFQRPCAKFCHNPARVLANISEKSQEGGPADLDLVALQELIYQSNPTLEPVIQWPHAPSMRFIPRTDNIEKRHAQGFIDQASRERSRISQWPQSPQRSRLDDLHSQWQLEDSVSARHNLLASAGVSTLEPLTAR